RLAQSRARVNIDSDTIKLWRPLYPKLTEDCPGLFGTATARAEAQVLRLALVYSLLDSEQTIGVDHLTAALAFWQYCRRSAAYIFGGREADPLSTKLLEALSKGEKTQTALHAYMGRNVSAGKLRGVLRELEATGRISQRTEGGGPGNGQPVT